jgi:hypothetical protein
MVLGHYGLAFGAKRLAPRTSLGFLVLAAQLADLFWPILLLTGVESVEIVRRRPALLRLDFVRYPITHSLLIELVSGVIFAALYLLFSTDRRGALVCALLVPSHWLLDVIVHVPDLPLWPGGPKFGLGVWHSPALTVALETVLFVGGVVVYSRSTRARDKVGHFSLWGFVVVLVAGYLSALVGPPPQDPASLAHFAVCLWVFVPWAFWIDRHRANTKPETLDQIPDRENGPLTQFRKTPSP